MSINPSHTPIAQKASPPSSCMEGEFFEVHGNKLKPYPFRNLGEASDEGVAHPVLLFRIRETPPIVSFLLS